MSPTLCDLALTMDMRSVWLTCGTLVGQRISRVHLERSEDSSRLLLERRFTTSKDQVTQRTKADLVNRSKAQQNPIAFSPYNNKRFTEQNETRS